MKDIYIFGTCRLCYPVHDNITFIKELRKYHSRYYKIGESISIYTEPVNYTTKLIDVLDSILYMKGKLYENLDATTNKNLQSIFFRGHYTTNDVINPKTHPLNTGDISFGKIILEAFSIKQYIINTKKYGDEFYLKNLPWKIDTAEYHHNGIRFDETDFISKTMSKDECFEVLNKIKEEAGCEVLIIGPYVSNKVPEHVNKERIEVQNILKEYVSLNSNVKYFDLSEDIKTHGNLEADETHFYEEGTKILSKTMYDFIVS